MGRTRPRGVADRGYYKWASYQGVRGSGIHVRHNDDSADPDCGCYEHLQPKAQMLGQLSFVRTRE